MHRHHTHAARTVPRAQLRSRAGLLLDLPFTPASAPWAATLWPDVRSPGGWCRLPWSLAPQRGWILPVDLALGDIVEFGGVSSTVDRRWWGLVEAYEPDVSLTLLGPMDTADDAHALAQHLLEQGRPAPLHLGSHQAGRCHHHR